MSAWIDLEETHIEELLNINTFKENYIRSVDKSHYFFYTPTRYLFLKKFFSMYKLLPNDRLVDFGCGKGRVLFYASFIFGNKCCGVEYDKKLYDDLNENKKIFSGSKKDNIDILNIQAENYIVKPNDNRFYFFNPFSLKIFIRVINNILSSYTKYRRKIHIILYAPVPSYEQFLKMKRFELIYDIDLSEYKEACLKSKIPQDIEDSRYYRFCVYEIK